MTKIIHHAHDKLFKKSMADLRVARELLFKPFQLIDIHRLDDEDLRKHLWSGLVEFVLKYRELQDFAKFLEFLLPWLDQIEQQDGANYGKLILKYVGHTIESNEAKLFLEKVEDYLTGTLKGEAMTLFQAFKNEGLQEGLQQGIQQGIQQGLQQGLQQGIEKEKRVMAIRLLSEGFDLQKVSKITELSMDVLEALQMEES